MWFLHLTSNLIIHNYYYRGKSQRQLVKTLIEVDNDIQNAVIKLNEAITEHDNYMNNNNIPNNGDTFNSIDNRSMHHAKEHLDAFLNHPEQILQKDRTIRALNQKYND